MLNIFNHIGAIPLCPQKIVQNNDSHIIRLPFSRGLKKPITFFCIA
ncbi:hypothetical protein HMPREF9104_03005 [Lentilactobacillus kisonensis F0435]|uniref:Uncharacterized protein n=1 Tax=Lentilactobacillus kisonensis F0435 TaxID=797516 RepID=H1LK59_9LACO|nr:hypothetical protein HMPREF9104_03005 [Lentilactobacillus kisonensis F0435]